MERNTWMIPPWAAEVNTKASFSPTRAPFSLSLSSVASTLIGAHSCSDSPHKDHYRSRHQIRKRHRHRHHYQSHRNSASVYCCLSFYPVFSVFLRVNETQGPRIRFRFRFWIMILRGLGLRLIDLFASSFEGLPGLSFYFPL